MTTEQARLILRLPEVATAAEVQAAYRKRARQTHPDVNPSNPKAAEEFREVQAAYEILGGNSINGVSRRATRHFTQQEMNSQYNDIMRAAFG